MKNKLGIPKSVAKGVSIGLLTMWTEIYIITHLPPSAFTLGLLATVFLVGIILALGQLLQGRYDDTF